MNWTNIVILIFIIAAVAGTIISVIVIYVKNDEKTRCYRAAANIVKEKYLQSSLLNPAQNYTEKEAIYSIRKMVYIKNLTSKPKKGYVYDLMDQVTFGRKTGCNVLLNETVVSGEHCRLFLDNDHVYLNDTSLNGTLLKRGINQLSVCQNTCEVLSGDKLTIGSSVFRITIFVFDGRIM